jgi:hypothetical protein
MSAVEVVVRGNVVLWVVQFTGVDGDPVIPDAVSVFVDYRTSEIDDTVRETIEIAMDEDSEGTFTADWTTTGAAAGRAFWSVRATNPDAAEDGVIQLKANPANPDPVAST